jgi:large repetitive protein
MKIITHINKSVVSVLVFFSINTVFGQLACDPTKVYDEIQSGYHSTIVTTPTGQFLCWGVATAANGTGNNLSPVAVTPANGYNYTGTPKLVAMGTDGASSPQTFLLTTTNLYVWGVEDSSIPTELTTSNAFQSIPLPTGVTPADIKDMVASFNALALITNSGEVWVNADVVDMYGVGATGPTIATNFWAKVTTSAAGNPFLTGVSQIRVTPYAFMAYTTTGAWYTWGTATNLADGSAVATRNRATPMQAPFVGTPIMLAMTSNGAQPSYFTINPANNKIYATGNNASGQLGRNNTTNQTGWVIVQNPTNTGDLNNVTFISGNDQDGFYAAIGCITSDKHLYIWGNNNGLGMIGQTGAGPFTLPVQPGGFVFGTDNPLYLEVGGHTSAYVKECAMV